MLEEIDLKVLSAVTQPASSNNLFRYTYEKGAVLAAEADPRPRPARNAGPGGEATIATASNLANRAARWPHRVRRSHRGG